LPKKVKKVAKKLERWETGKIGSIFQQVRSNLVRGDPGSNNIGVRELGPN